MDCLQFWIQKWLLWQRRYNCLQSFKKMKCSLTKTLGLKVTMTWKAKRIPCIWMVLNPKVILIQRVSTGCAQVNTLMKVRGLNFWKVMPPQMKSNRVLLATAGSSELSRCLLPEMSSYVDKLMPYLPRWRVWLTTRPLRCFPWACTLRSSTNLDKSPSTSSAFSKILTGGTSLLTTDCLSTRETDSWSLASVLLMKSFGCL